MPETDPAIIRGSSAITWVSRTLLRPKGDRQTLEILNPQRFWNHGISRKRTENLLVYPSRLGAKWLNSKMIIKKIILPINNFAKLRLDVDCRQRTTDNRPHNISTQRTQRKKRFNDFQRFLTRGEAPFSTKALERHFQRGGAAPVPIANLKLQRSTILQ